MEHRLRILVRLDIDHSSVTLLVTGCLTNNSYRAMLPVIRRASALIQGFEVVVDLRNAQHVDEAAAEALSDSIQLESDHQALGAVTLHLPGVPRLCTLLASHSSAELLVYS